MALLGIQVGLKDSEDGDRADDRRLLQVSGLPAEGPGLLRFFRERTLSGEQVQALEKQVGLLGSPVFAERQKASVALTRAGPFAKKLLLDVVKNPQSALETVRRAEAILKKIAGPTDMSNAMATARLIAHDKPPDSGKVLLDYVPFASEPTVMEEVQYALNALAIQDGIADPAFIAAVADKHAGKRASAGEAIVRGGGLAFKSAVARLLGDASPQVRLAVTSALIEARDKKCVPLLIDLMPTVAREQVWTIEETLNRLAGDKAPQVWVGAKTSARDAGAAWLAWWEKHQDEVDLAKLAEAPKYRGFLLVTFGAGAAGGKGTSGKIMEIRPSKEIVWQLDGLRYPVDAQSLSKDRVLITEYLERKITERDLRGNILWEQACDIPIACQRLPNGHLFLATRRKLSIIDREGKEVLAHLTPSPTVCAAGRARDGHMVYVNSKGACTWLDAAGNEVKSFQVGKIFAMAGTIDVLPGNRIVLALAREGRVAEFDREGNVVWQAAVQTPTCALRLPNGNTLVASGQRVIELNRAGQEVWSFQVEGGRPFRLRPR